MKTVGANRQQPQARPSTRGDLRFSVQERAGAAFLEERSGHAPAADSHLGTRNRVARLILSSGQCTAAELADNLGLTPAGVRRHLDALLAEGLIEARDQRVYGPRGRGRPAKVFSLTSEGRAVFHHAYDGLAVEALRFLAQLVGEHAVDEFARRRFAEFAERYRRRLTTAAPAERPQVLAEALTGDGYAASMRPAGSSAPAPAGSVSGEQLCQHHCPVQHVAEQFPQLCEAETQLFADLLGTHVQRLATIAHGDGVCTTFIPSAAAAKPRPESRRVPANDAPQPEGAAL